MRYFSTRDKDRLHPFSLKQAAHLGLAPDGGLFVPERIPKVDLDLARSKASESYPALAGYLATLFFGDDIPEAAIYAAMDRIYDFPITLAPVGPRRTLELFHGPTCAFKDFGARFMGAMLELLQVGGEHLTILTATSGDTGSAVAGGFFGVPGIDVVVLFPEGKVSPLQESQMTSLGGNIHAIGIDGTFDDCQRVVKEIFSDSAFRARYNVSSANSINLLRWIPQSFYYFMGYFLWEKTSASSSPLVVVPSGNYGNLSAGMLARRMGLPIAGFVAASNDNDVIPELLETGIYRPRPSVSTVANAMDVGAPSNYERMLWLEDYSGGTLEGELKGFRASNEDIKRTISYIYKEFGYISDPHSAVGFAASERYGSEGFYLSTAHPAKFSEVISPLIGKDVEIPERLSVLLARPKRKTLLPADKEMVESFVEEKDNCYRQCHQK